ncbi:MAG: L-2-hydroxyglutarate oxidase [Gammaproteobacteria bacterium]
MPTPDFLIIGGGVIGLNVAREIKRSFADASVTLIEKEASCGAHASGRNSGVLHAGFYYTADSLKAKFTRDGNRLLTEYCEDRKIPLNRCGKLVVARDEAEDQMLDELLRRGQRNGVELEEVTAEEAREIEPRAITFRRAIFSPTTSSADPSAVLSGMEQDARNEGVSVRNSETYVGAANGRVTTTRTVYDAGYVINAAGLYADKVARDFGFSQRFRILPFKGLYLKSSAPPGEFRTNIYPVPDLNNPFLGVHVTVQVDGHVKLGPTAIPALWREQYNGLDNFQVKEFVEIASRSASFFATSAFDFKRLALAEMRKYSRRHMVSLASSLAHGITEATFKSWSKPGIRAQLVDIQARKLEMDFVLEGDHKSMHVLNAVSPGWTCSIPFARHVVAEIKRRLQ